MSEIEKFWRMINTDDLKTSEAGYKKWKEYEQKYPHHFENIKEKFSKKFYKTFGKLILHDFLVVNINTSYNPIYSKKSEVRLLLYDYFEEYGKDIYFNLTYRNVETCVLHLPSIHSDLSWYDDIFEEIENNRLKHRIALINDAYIEITFKTISITKVKKEKNESVG